jgi:hypothetical protein
MVSLTASSAWAQNHLPFQIARPVGAGAAGVGLDTHNRVYRAYPGIAYQIHADATGGHWPYTYTLSAAPAGMTIEPGPCLDIGPSGCTAGTITWPNPTLGTHGPVTVTIRDADGDTVTGTWSIVVSNAIGADGFCFLDADDGDDNTGSGSLAAPYRSIAKAHASCGPRSIIYFRGATADYTIASTIEDGSAPGDCDLRVQWPEASRGVIWLGYPGERPVINFESNGDAQPCFQMQGANIWIDNLELKNIGSIGFKFNLRLGSYGAVVRNVYAHDLRFGGDGKNSSFFMWTRCDDCPTWFDTVQNSRFSNVSTGACSLKLYGIKYGLFETSAYATTLSNEGDIALKGTVPHYTVRANTCAADVLTCFGGNMATAPPCSGTCETTGGELYHNLVLGSGTADSSEGAITIGVAKVTSIAETWVYRNTLLGQVSVSSLEAQDGPYYFNNNVIVNSGGSGGACPPRLTCSGVATYSPIVMGNNLQGAPGDGFVDANGRLQGSHRASWLGQRGYELAGSVVDTLSPSAPTNLQAL